jgi:hypothetical protein
VSKFVRRKLSDTNIRVTCALQLPEVIECPWPMIISNCHNRSLERKETSFSAPSSRLSQDRPVTVRVHPPQPLPRSIMRHDFICRRAAALFLETTAHPRSLRLGADVVGDGSAATHVGIDHAREVAMALLSRPLERGGLVVLGVRPRQCLTHVLGEQLGQHCLGQDGRGVLLDNRAKRLSSTPDEVKESLLDCFGIFGFSRATDCHPTEVSAAKLAHGLKGHLGHDGALDKDLDGLDVRVVHGSLALGNVGWHCNRFDKLGG